MRVVCSLTTVPLRLLHGRLVNTLRSLNNQTHHFDAIYLTIPQGYPEVPSEISALCQPVYTEKDYGPLTKLVGGLLQESDPTTIIIVLDDDYIYPPTLVEKLLGKHFKYPGIAIGSTGTFIKNFPYYFSLIRNQASYRYTFWNGHPISNTGLNVDILCGYAGILYERGFFPCNNKLKKLNKFLDRVFLNKDIFCNDDIYVSAYLSSKNIEKNIPNARGQTQQFNSWFINQHV